MKTLPSSEAIFRACAGIFFFGQLVLLEISPCAAASPDSDNDGLTDSDEVALYHTDPSRWDTDGDGQSDGAEVRAGTDPRDRASVFKIVTPLSRLGTGGWKVTWTSTPGKHYRLQRLESDNVAATPARWIDVAGVQASGPLASAEDGLLATKRFYRVVLEDNQVTDTVPPDVAAPTASPSPVQAEGVVTLIVTATDNVAVSGVNLFDAGVPIGQAALGENNRWRLFWPVTFDQNGNHLLTARAFDQSGNSATSSVANLSIAIPNRQAVQTIGTVQLKADAFSGGLPSGNVRAGLVSFSDDSSITLDAAAGTILGTGKVSLPGTGLVLDGPFTLNGASGILQAGAGATLPIINLSSKVSLQSSQLQVQVQSGAVSGKGSITLTLPTGAGQLHALHPEALSLGPVTIEGDYQLDPAAQSLTVTGKVTYARVEGSGVIQVRLSDSTFSLSNGSVRFLRTDATEAFVVTAANFSLQITANQTAEFLLGGKPTLPALTGLNLALTGKMDPAGNAELSGEASGELRGFNFAPVKVTASRRASDSNVTLSFLGAVSGNVLGQVSLNGTLGSSGAVVDLTSSASVTLGNGIRIQPLKDPSGNDIPILRLTTAGQTTAEFSVSGNFLAPHETGTREINVRGSLVLEKNGAEFQMKSLVASNSAVLGDWILPGKIQLQNAGLFLNYTQTQFKAVMTGAIVLAKIGPIATAAIDLRAELQIDPNDPESILIDSDISVDKLDLLEKIFLQRGRFHISANTKPVTGELKIVEADAGLFPRDAILSNGKIVVPPDRSLGPDDFNLYVTGLKAGLAYRTGGIDLSLTGGSLRLPSSFTTLAAGECTQPGLPLTGPTLALAPNTALTVHIDETIDSASLRFEGALDFGNLGFTIPGSNNQPSPGAVKLCSARLRFQGEDLPALENLSGRLRLEQIGTFELVSGSINPKGSFDLLMQGDAAFSGVNLHLANLHATYQDRAFGLDSSLELDLGNGIILRPDDTQPGDVPPVVHVVYDDAAGKYEFQLAGKVQLPSGEFVAMRGRITEQNGQDKIELSSTGEVRFGDGLRVRGLLDPSDPNHQRQLPALKLVAADTTQTSFEVRGEFLVPADGGTRSLEVQGSLSLGKPNGEFQVLAFQAASSTTNEWQLPGKIRLLQAGVNLKAQDRVFTAALQGQVQIDRVTATLDQAILTLEDKRDAANIRLDTQITLQNLSLGQAAFLQVGSARLEVGTQVAAGTFARNAYGRISISGTGGIAAKGPLPQTPTADNFYFLIDQLKASFDFNAQGFVVALTNGTLRLPEILQNVAPSADLCPGEAPRPSIALTPSSSLLLAVVFASNPADPPTVSVRANGALNFAKFGFKVPDLPGLQMEVCSADLGFPTEPNGLPFLQNVSGRLQIPLPPGQTTRVDVVNGAWKLNGFPSGTILLANDIVLYDKSGFSFTLLGGNSCGANNIATGLTVEEGGTIAGGVRPPQFTLNGGIRFAVPRTILKKAASAVGAAELGLDAAPPADQVTIETCGSMTVFPDRLPDLQLTRISVSGDFELGAGGGGSAALYSLQNEIRPNAGTSAGIKLKGATITLDNLQNIFNTAQDPPNPFTITLSGKILVPNGPGFGMQNARFVFNNLNPAFPGLPEFKPGALEYEKNEWQLLDALPLQITKARIEFLDKYPRLPEILRPDNVKITMSGKLSLPPDEPMFEGQFDDASVTFETNGIPSLSLRGLGMTIQGLDIPPLEDIGGKVYLGGLDTPSRIFFTGKVGGSYDGYKLNLLLAFNLTGPIGACIDVNLGSVGIPLDGYQLGGILLTGAAGGVSLANSNSDPCEFTAYIDDQGYPKFSQEPPMPPMTWKQLREFTERYAHRAQLFSQSAPAARVSLNSLPADLRSTVQLLDAMTGRTNSVAELNSAALASSGPIVNEFDIPCPGDCPPPTINIFCQPHPDQAKYPNRVIGKFSSINEPTLNALGITQEAIAAFLRTNIAANIPANTAHNIRGFAESLIPRPGPSLPKATEINQVITDSLDALEQAIALQISTGLDAIAGEKTASAIYSTIVELAYKGAPCPDVTLKLTGTMTYQYVSSFLSADAGVVISTAGAAGVVGNVNLVGIPAGKFKGFVAATDEKGQLNPSVCGQLDYEFGPLKLGSMATSLRGIASDQTAFAFFKALGSCLPQPDLAALVNRVAPRINVTGKTGEQVLNELTQQEKVALIAELYRRPAIPDLVPCLSASIGSAWDAFNPEYLMCGEVKPKLFGIPLSPSLMAYAARATKTNYVVVGADSPSFRLAMMVFAVGAAGTEGLAVAGGPAVALVANALLVQDKAQIAYRLDWPDANEALLAALAGRLSSPQAISNYVAQSFDYMLQHGTYTWKYELSPLGFRTVDFEQRVINPNLVAHPARPGSTWLPPERRTPVLPSRFDLLLAALTNRLIADIRWSGSASDLNTAFADGSVERTQTAGLSFANDYFPHGGLLGGGYLQFPRAFVEAPPHELAVIVDESKDTLTRMLAFMSYMENYVMKSTAVGALGYYVPAANPPYFTDAQGQALTPQKLLEAINSADPFAVQSPGLYPIEQFFLRGYLQGDLLGVPIGRADLTIAPPDLARGIPAMFQARANVPTNSWLNQFVDQANLMFQMRDCPPQRVDVWGSNVVQALQPYLGAAPTGVSSADWERQRQQKFLEFASGLATNLPKISLEATLQNLHVPPALVNVLSVPDGQANFSLMAYSPRFEPGFRGTGYPNDGPVADVRRNGGIALQGNLRFANLISVPNAELKIQPQGTTQLPILSGRFQNLSFTAPGGFPVANGTLEFVSQPLSLKAAGHLARIDLPPAMHLAPLDGQPDLSFSVDLASRSSSTLVVSPAQLTVDLQGTGTKFRVHGATPNDPFSYSSVGPWNASVTISSSLSLLDSSGAVALQVATPGLTGTIGRAAGSGRTDAVINLPAGLSLSVYPGKAYQQTMTLSAAASLRISSDGTFAAQGATSTPIALSNLPVANFQAGASFTMTQSGLTVTGALSGGVLSQITVSGTVTGTLTVTSAGGITLSGSINVSPLVLGQFRVDPASGTTFTATLNNNGLTIPAGAKLSYNGTSLGTFTLPSFTIAASGNFSLNQSSVSVSLNGFTIANASFTFQRSSGTTSLVNLTGSLRVPGAGGTTLANVSVTGTLASNGSYSVTGTTASAVALSGLAVTSLSSGATATLSSNGLTVTGALTGGVLSQITVSGTVTGTLTVTSAGGTTLSGSINVSRLVLGQFRVDPASGTTFTATLNNNGLTIPAGAKLSYNGTSLGTFTLPSFTIAASGNFSLTESSVSVSLNGFTIASASFTFQRSSGATSIQNFAGNISIPGVNAGTTTTLTGSINSNGSYTLTWLGTLKLGSFPLTSGSLTLQNSGLTAGGTLTINGLSPTLSFTGTISATGSFSMSRTQSTQTFYGFSVQNATYTLAASAGGAASLSVAFNVNIASISSARFNGTMRADGFADLTTSLASWNVAGYGLTSVNFEMTHSAGSAANATLSVFGTLNVPNVPAKRLGGTISTGGTISMRYDGSVSLGGFTAANGSLVLTSNGGLSASGSFNISAAGATFNSGLSFSGNIPTTGLFDLAGSGSLSFGGFTTDTFNLKLSKDGLFIGEGILPRLNFGSLSVPFTVFSLNSGGITSFSGSADRDSGWQRFFDKPFGDDGDVYARLAGSVGLSSSSNGTISANLNYTWAGWVVYTKCNPGFPVGDGKCTTYYGPDDINNGSGKFTGSGSISSDGSFTINTSFGDLSSFGFDLW